MTNSVNKIVRNQLPNSFKAIGLQFPHFLNKKLTLKNVEHALCEYDKYYRTDTSQPSRDEEEDFDVIN